MRNPAKASRLDRAGLVAVLAAWLGVWGAWIPHKTVSLTQNALNLAEWSTMLNDVRFGPYAQTPDMLRLAVALASVALAVAAGFAGRPWVRWGLRAAALLPGLVLFPPYPYFLSLWRSPQFGGRFVIAVVLWLGVAASFAADRLPGRQRRGLVVLLTVLALALGGRAHLVLRGPFSAHYNAALLPGWGLVVFVLGLLAAAAAHGWALAARKRKRAS